MALVLSFVIKRDSEIVDYEDAFGEMKTVDDINLLQGAIYFDIYIYISKNISTKKCISLCI